MASVSSLTTQKLLGRDSQSHSTVKAVHLYNLLLESIIAPSILQVGVATVLSSHGGTLRAQYTQISPQKAKWGTCKSQVRDPKIPQHSLGTEFTGSAF